MERLTLVHKVLKIFIFNGLGGLVNICSMRVCYLIMTLVFLCLRFDLSVAHLAHRPYSQCCFNSILVNSTISCIKLLLMYSIENFLFAQICVSQQFICPTIFLWCIVLWKFIHGIIGPSLYSMPTTWTLLMAII